MFLGQPLTNDTREIHIWVLQVHTNNLNPTGNWEYHCPVYNEAEIPEFYIGALIYSPMLHLCCDIPLVFTTWTVLSAVGEHVISIWGCTAHQWNISESLFPLKKKPEVILIKAIIDACLWAAEDAASGAPEYKRVLLKHNWRGLSVSNLKSTVWMKTVYIWGLNLPCSYLSSGIQQCLCWGGKRNGKCLSSPWALCSNTAHCQTYLYTLICVLFSRVQSKMRPMSVQKVLCSLQMSRRCKISI